MRRGNHALPGIRARFHHGRPLGSRPCDSRSCAKACSRQRCATNTHCLAGYSSAVNYQLQCEGCHLGDGTGSAANDTPKMKGFVGNFLKVDGGREFLVRVPGVSQSALNNAQVADLLNWMMRADGIAGGSAPQDYRPYSEAEVAEVRGKPILDLPQARAGMIEQMRVQGIAIDDGVTN